MSGCCTSIGTCALNCSTCFYRYLDYKTNQSYHFNWCDFRYPTNVAMVVGSSLAGCVGLLIIIAIVWWCWRKRNSAAEAHTAKQNTYGNTGGTTIVMTTNQSLPTYGNEDSFNNTLNPVPM